VLWFLDSIEEGLGSAIEEEEQKGLDSILEKKGWGSWFLKKFSQRCSACVRSLKRHIFLFDFLFLAFFLKINNLFPFFC